MKEPRSKRGSIHFCVDLIGAILDRAFFSPITHSQILLNLAALVTMLLFFLGTVTELAEGIFGVANDFRDEVQRLDHSALSFRCAASSGLRASGTALFCLQRNCLWQSSFE